MNKPQMSTEQVDAVEKALKRKYGNKLPLFFIVFLAAVCAWVEMVSPAVTYGGHFMRLAFFGWFSWTICKMLEEAANRWKKQTTDDIKKST